MSALKIKTLSGTWQEIPMIKGDKGDKGEQGDTYELTEQDKQDIAELVEVPEPLKYVKDDPSDNGGVIEGNVNGTDRYSPNIATGIYSHAEGAVTTSSGGASHAEGSTTIASGNGSHAEGGFTTASNQYSHSEGFKTIASGQYSHTEGQQTTASNWSAHAEGTNTVSSGAYSHTEGLKTIANHRSQHVFGELNIEDPSSATNNERGEYIEIIGNGNYDTNTRSNAYTLDWQGNGVYAGKLTVGTAPTNDMDVATKKYVDDVKGASIHICSSSEYDSTTRVPTIQTPDEKTFYLVPSEDGTSPDLFVEWAYVNNAWEMFGSASIDLSGYLTDVTVGGNSVVNNGVANIPVAGSNILGTIMVANNTHGLALNNYGRLMISEASSESIKIGNNTYNPVTPLRQHESTFYGFAKASGDATQAQSSNSVGTYTDEAKASIQTMLGVPSVDDIPDVPVEDVQIDGTSILNNKVANVPIADNSNNAGVVRVSNGLYGLQMRSDGKIAISNAGQSEIKAQSDNRKPITSYYVKEAAFYGLASAAGDATQKQSSNAVGTYTPEAKGAIQSMLGIDSLIAPTETNPFTNAHAIGDLFIINGTLYRAKTTITVGDVLNDGVNAEAVNVDDVIVKDVQVNGTSVLNDGVANIPVMSSTTFGVARAIGENNGIIIDNGGALRIDSATSTVIKSGTGGGSLYKPITPYTQHESTFYGLAKASGDTTQSQSDNPVGTYTDEAKASIKNMLGVEDNMVVTVTGTGQIRQIDKSLSEIISALEKGSNVVVYDNDAIYPYVGTTLINGALVYAFGISVLYDNINVLNGYLIGSDGEADFAMPVNQQTTIPQLNDVQINGTSIVENGVANVPVANRSALGVVKIDSNNGVAIAADGKLYISAAIDGQIQQGAGGYRPITPPKQHASTFYGLAKAAGDTTQSQSSNAVGSYTEEAKAKIQSMLGFGGFELIKTVELTEDSANIEIDTDEAGNAFKLTEFFFIAQLQPSASTTQNATAYVKNNRFAYYVALQSIVRTTLTRVSGYAKNIFVPSSNQEASVCQFAIGGINNVPAFHWNGKMPQGAEHDYSEYFSLYTIGTAKFGAETTLTLYGRRK